MTLDQWVESTGKQFEKADKQQNWLGGEVVEFVLVGFAIKFERDG
jgi:hypothetical protein